MVFDFVNHRVEVRVADIVRLVETSWLNYDATVAFGVRVKAFDLLTKGLTFVVWFYQADSPLNSTNSVEFLPLRSFKVASE